MWEEGSGCGVKGVGRGCGEGGRRVCMEERGECVIIILLSNIIMK